MKPVEIVKISKLIKIYKNGEQANAIEVARVINDEGEELQYNIIVGKNIYNVGDDVIYIQPDYCIPQNNIFMEYHFPGGDKSKCKLGKKGRIRAIKFNFNFENECDPIYSCGIILPMSDEIKNVINSDQEKELYERFDIFKYVADDSFENQQNSGFSESFPSNLLYMTDEITIQNKKSVVDRCFENNEVLSGTIKKDGSSITLYYSDGEQQGICSRKQKKKLDQSFVKTYIDNGVELTKYLNKDTNVLGWYNNTTNVFYTDEECESKFESIILKNKDSWVDTALDNNYYQNFVEYCKTKVVKLALRGELIGMGNKGSGNKLNQDAKLQKSDIYFFGLDDLSSGFSRRLNESDEYNLPKISKDLNLKYSEPVFEGVFNYDDLIKKCHEIFKKIKEETGQVIEGIVIRTKFSNNLSVKYINPEYDAKS